VLDLVHEGRRLGQEVTVVCLEQPGRLADEAEGLGARVVCADKPPGLRWKTVGRLRALFRELAPDVVHTHQIGALFYAGPAARRAGVRAVVHTEHGKHYAARRRTRLLGRLAARHVGRFCCVSADIADEVVRCGIVAQRKVAVVANGIDVPRFSARDGADEVRRSLGIPPGAPVVGTIGRLNEIKRQDSLIRAFVRIQSEAPGARLLLVGDGPLRDDLRRLADGLGVGDAVHFPGYDPEPQRFLGVMDVFALTSRSEGMPLVVLEAWAAGLPVVASRVGGLPELIDDGRTGLLFDPDDEGALVSALGGLLADADRARRLGAAGFRRVDEVYSLRRMAENYNSHYRDVLAGRGVGRPAHLLTF
jgi:glycosyltransferase involved in cell wall biosynthesis